MALPVRAIYENGQLRLLDPVDLREGQTVTVNIEPVSEQNALRAVLGDLIRWSDPDINSDEWVEAEAQNIDRTFQGEIPLSQYIIEDRGEG